MSVADKLTTIVENEQKVYDAGKQAAYDWFWDRYQLDGVKVLGNGTLEKKLTIQANKFSASALEKIKESGSKAEVI